MAKTDSRTSKSIKNSSVALFFYFINLILQFFSRKIFLDYLGAEVLGLNTTATNLLQFLNLAELGIGAAVSYNLYKPLFDGNRQAINDIVSIQGWLYRRIALMVIAGACVLMCFFPLIFAKAEVPLWYTYGTFLALLTGALLGYFVNYRQIVLSADQKEYKITYAVQGMKLLKVFFQMVAIYLLTHGYVWWMVLEVAFAVATSAVLDRAIKKEYSWLCPKISQGSELRYRYPAIIIKTKQVFFHKIASFVLSQTSPLIIYAYASLSLVAIYGNYMLIVAGVVALMNALFNGINASIGNLVAEDNKVRIKAVFWKIATLRMWLASIICFGMYLFGDAFITLWIGEDYVLPRSTFAILLAVTFINLTRASDTFLSAYGLFKDIWAPLVEAILNLGLSILFGYYWGLIGIVSGVLISLIIIVNSWKPFFLYSNGFKDNVKEYSFLYTRKLFLLFSPLGVIIGGLSHFAYFSSTTHVQQIEYGLIILLLYVLFSLLILYNFDNTIRNLLQEIIKKIQLRLAKK